MSVLSQYLNHPEVHRAKEYYLSAILNGGEKPPALTTGLTAFLVMLWVVSLFNPGIIENFALYPEAITEFELGRLSSYPLVHTGFFHLFLNLVSLIPPLATFERNNGTVHTGIVLNLLASVTGILYSILGLFFYPDAAVVGSSGWCFSFFAYFAYKQSINQPYTSFFGKFNFPTVLVPFQLLVIIALLVPSSSIIGHFFGILAGYALAYGLLDPLTCPPFDIINKIETAAEKGIEFVQNDFLYVKESEAKELRAAHHTAEILPMHFTAAATGEVKSTPFQGKGQAVGTESAV